MKTSTSPSRFIGRGPNILRLILVLLFVGCLTSLPALAQQAAPTFPAGFSAVLVASGITNPTALAFAPDGRIFVCQQTGQLRVINNGSLVSTPFVSLAVNSSGERGLVGIAIDPGYLSNHYIYLYYTLASGANNRISRFTANGDVAVAGSETLVLNLDPLSTATNHNGGAMHFGLDGKLYVAVGENANRTNAPNLDSYMGKLLRINADGSVPAGNPYVGSSLSAQRQRVWSYGLRNPFTFAVQPVTGTLFINDVGEGSWEEINNASVGGRNFGWPSSEGYSVRTGETAPVFAYPHASGFPDGTGCSITGGTFFNPSATNYPSQYVGKYFYQDYCGKWINYIDPNSSTTPPARAAFALNMPGDALALETGPDGNLYYLARNGASLFKVVYTATTSAPVITTQPASVAVVPGAAATFSVAAAGSTPLSYQWQKNGVNIAGATGTSYTIASVVAADAGQYRAVVTNSVGTATSTAATLTVTAPNTAPTAQILTPASGTTYVAGTTISFSGSATDAEDGPLPASAFVWQVDLHHDTHVHDGTPFSQGSQTGTFTIPNSGETAANVFYRLILTVTDAGGVKTSTYRDILPQTSTISLATNPAGLSLTLDGTPQAAPASILGVEGILRTLGAPSPQTMGGVTYEFVSWSNGGAQTQTIAIPTNDATYTANFQPVSTSTLRNPDNPANPVAGLDYTYYQGTWNALPAFSGLTATASGTVPTFSLAPRLRDDNFAFRYTGYVSVPTDGIYTFYTSSDDGSQLFIGSTLVVDNDGLHGTQERTGQIGLKAGLHAITVSFFEQAGAEVLEVNYAGPGLTKTAVPTTALFRTTTGSTLRIPDNPANPVAGLNYAYYQGSWGTLPAFSGLTATTSGTVSTFSLSPRLRDDNFAFRYTGYVSVPTDGIYTFYTSSDDGSQLFIGSTLVVDNDGQHGTQERTGQIGLKAGLHAVTVGFFERGGDQVLNVSYAGPGLTKALVPATALFRTATGAAARTQPGPDRNDAVMLYPNPAQDQVSIGFQAEAGDKVLIEVRDPMGYRVATTTHHATPGPNEARLSLRGLRSGVYTVIVQQGNKRTVRPLILVP
ncbi:PQQ-dependent sugar dehydrogenase [Hymenobacter negativus]|uniref:PQQ-dependent sugar dehydrogenase n=1 Tax=Hymenobacter negativus TaxID=2795026 RepID=A0ABS3QBY4_9BACT|nr:PQQ-dependent sugar dehydrogenase [Hymenobacter negativus]MBO2008745.1 PQQ-dependent sugar dehydrogenase [Hymenobacter negativus]